MLQDSKNKEDESIPKNLREEAEQDFNALSDEEKDKFLIDVGLKPLSGMKELKTPHPIKRENKKLSKEEKIKQAKKKDKFFVARIFLMTLILSVVFSLITEVALSGGNLILSFAILVLLIFISIVFDTIGTAATSCDIQPFISKASRKDRTAVVAMNLLKNAERVASFCNDVVGDICGIVSGGCAGAIVLVIATQAESSVILLSVLFSAVVSAITVGGKAIGKLIAMRGSEKIITFVAKFMSIFKKKS